MSLAVGIDISKKKLDVCMGNSYAQIGNNKKDIISFFKDKPKDSPIVMEATGKYHRLAHQALEDMGFLVMVVNPYQSKNFAKAMNLLCKTDKVDAKMLATFAEKMDFKPTPCAEPNQQKILDLSRHLDDLKQIKVDLEHRQKEADGFIGKSLKATAETVKKEIKKTEKALEQSIEEDESMQRNLTLLLTIPGVGLPTAISLLSYLRELGKVGKRQISALSGLAPMNNDSGSFQGKRRIRGGRHDVRTNLYMPIVGAATQHNKRLMAFYNKLISNGKPKKVALTACMRKLVVWANAMIASGERWDESGLEQA